MSELNQDLGLAYAEFRAVIEGVVAKLGGDSFAFVVVTEGARDAFRYAAPRTRDANIKSFMSFCEPLVASAGQLREAARLVRNKFAPRVSPASFTATLGNAKLVVRDDGLYFETEQASALFVHWYSDRSSTNKWTTAITSEAATYLVEHGMQKPSVSIAHSKSADGAHKSMVRMVQQHFKVELEPVALTAEA